MLGQCAVPQCSATAPLLWTLPSRHRVAVCVEHHTTLAVAQSRASREELQRALR
jgi:hypothetical protein